MPRRHRRISYVKKPFARKSLVGTGFLLVALLSFGMSLGLSIQSQGNGEINIAAWGITSVIFTVLALSYSASSFLEKEKNYIFSKISLVISGILLLFWLCVIIVGLLV